MAHLQIEQRLETLGGQSIFHVVLPEAGDLHEAPVIYLLHGAGDNGTGWLRYTAAERCATEKGLVLIIPGVGNSWIWPAVYRRLPASRRNCPPSAAVCLA